MTDVEVQQLVRMLEEQITVWQKNATGATSRELMLYSLGFQYGLSTALALIKSFAAKS